MVDKEGDNSKGLVLEVGDGDEQANKQGRETQPEGVRHGGAVGGGGGARDGTEEKHKRPKNPPAQSPTQEICQYKYPTASMGPHRLFISSTRPLLGSPNA